MKGKKYFWPFSCKVLLDFKEFWKSHNLWKLKYQFQKVRERTLFLIRWSKQVTKAVATTTTTADSTTMGKISNSQLLKYFVDRGENERRILNDEKCVKDEAEKLRKCRRTCCCCLFLLLLLLLLFFLLLMLLLLFCYFFLLLLLYSVVVVVLVTVLLLLLLTVVVVVQCSCCCTCCCSSTSSYCRCYSSTCCCFYWCCCCCCCCIKHLMNFTGIVQKWRHRDLFFFQRLSDKPLHSFTHYEFNII